MAKITIIEGNSNDKDDVRAYMVKGEKGATIASITKTATEGLIDTYTITMDDGRTQIFTVTNGRNIVSVEKTSTQGLVDTYTITFNDNTTQTFTIKNGFSPTASVTKVGSVSTFTVTDEEGTTTTNINDGQTYEVPVNGVIGFDGTTIPAGYEEVPSLLSGTVLYDNSNGTDATITLNDSSVNYDRLLIEFFETGLNSYSTTEVLAPNNKLVALTTAIRGNTNNYLYTARINISGTSITWANNERVQIQDGSQTTSVNIKITKIIGYKY